MTAHGGRRPPRRIRMQRTLEPELMLDDEQARAYAKADFESAHSQYPKLFAECFPNRPAQALVTDAPTVISTDPPYYDNIGYADLSDYFYVWLRRSLKAVFPDLFTTLTVPKADELVATPDAWR